MLHSFYVSLVVFLMGANELDEHDSSFVNHRSRNPANAELLKLQLIASMQQNGV